MKHNTSSTSPFYIKDPASRNYNEVLMFFSTELLRLSTRTETPNPPITIAGDSKHLVSCTCSNGFCSIGRRDPSYIYRVEKSYPITN